MSLPRLLITRRLADAALAHAATRFDVTLWPEDAPIGDAFDTLSQDQDAILFMANDPMTAERLARLVPRTRAIATYSVGHEHIDLAAATRVGLPVFFAGDALSDAVADTALFLILAGTRDTTRNERLLRTGQWGPWSPTAFVSRDLKRKRLGIFGMGRIGQAIARRARSFGLAIHYHNRSRLPADLEAGAQYHATLDDLMRVSDILCCAAPLSVATRGAISRERIALLPRGAVFTNIARGDLVDEDALIEAVRDGHIGGLGLDVYRNEPRIDPRFLELPNTTLLPHVGSAALDTRVDMANLVVDALADYIAHGVRADNVLNPEAWKS